MLHTSLWFQCILGNPRMKQNNAEQFMAEANNHLLKAMTSNNNKSMLAAPALLQCETSKVNKV